MGHSKVLGWSNLLFLLLFFFVFKCKQTPKNKICASKHYFYDVVVLGFKQFHSYLYNYKLHTTLFLTTYYYWWWNPLLVFKRKHLLPSSALLRIVKLFIKKEDKCCPNSISNWRHQTLLVNFDVGKKKSLQKSWSKRGISRGIITLLSSYFQYKKT